MDIEYRTKKLEKVCTDAHKAQQEYGSKMAEKIHQRIDEISVAASVEFMIEHRIGRCHALSNNRNGQYAVDLVQPYRMIFTKTNNELKIVRIEEITDYH